MYTNERGSAFEIVKYLGAGEFLIDVISKKGGHYRSQIRASAILNFNLDEYKRNANIKDAEVPPKATVSTEVKQKRKRRRK